MTLPLDELRTAQADALEVFRLHGDDVSVAIHEEAGTPVLLVTLRSTRPATELPSHVNRIPVRVHFVTPPHAGE